MSMKASVDHLMWGAPDLDAGMAEAGRLFGATPVPGGAHAGLGTRNALVGLADGRYLEIIAPDPGQPLAGTFGQALADLSHPALVTWALGSRDLPRIAAHYAAAGLQTRGPVPTRRTTPDGEQLEWELLFASGHAFGPLLPFFIDWRDCPHPSAGLAVAGALEAVTLESPHAAELRKLLGHLDVPVVVREAAEPAFHATIETAHGPVVLESSPATLGLRFGPK
ncbi:MAG: VOC family protein [Pseudomonadales bacterium]